MPEKDPPGLVIETAEDSETEIAAWGEAVLVEWTVQAGIITEWTVVDKITAANALRIILHQVAVAVLRGITREGQVAPVVALITTDLVEEGQGHPSAHPHQVGPLKVEQDPAEVVEGE